MQTRLEQAIEKIAYQEEIVDEALQEAHKKQKNSSPYYDPFETMNGGAKIANKIAEHDHNPDVNTEDDILNQIVSKNESTD